MGEGSIVGGETSKLPGTSGHNEIPVEKPHD